MKYKGHKYRWYLASWKPSLENMMKISYFKWCSDSLKKTFFPEEKNNEPSQPQRIVYGLRIHAEYGIMQIS